MRGRAGSLEPLQVTRVTARAALCLTDALVLAVLVTRAGKPIRRYGFYYMAAISGVAFFARGFQQSYFRLKGTRPNPDECARAGIPFSS